MKLNLVRANTIRDLQRRVQPLHREVGDTEVANHARIFERLQAREGLGHRDLSIGPVDQQQVEIVGLQFAQKARARCDDRIAMQVRPANLRREEEFFSADRGFPDGPTDRWMILISIGRIDVAIANRQGCFHHRDTRVTLERPGAETKNGNARHFFHNTSICGKGRSVKAMRGSVMRCAHYYPQECPSGVYPTWTSGAPASVRQDRAALVVS